MKRIVAVAMLSAPLIGGCVMHQKKVMHTLENPAPVNCATAEGDLRVLQGEKTHVAQQILEEIRHLRRLVRHSGFSR